MYYYEIKNDKTQEWLRVNANNFKEACEKLGVKTRDCHCIYWARIE